jgi:hypothetical protein
MPYSIKCLGNVKEGCRTVLFRFYCFVYCIHYAMSLVYGRKSLSEAELVVW